VINDGEGVPEGMNTCAVEYKQGQGRVAGLAAVGLRARGLRDIPVVAEKGRGEGGRQGGRGSGRVRGTKYKNARNTTHKLNEPTCCV
jgi:hypothetical protein